MNAEKLNKLSNIGIVITSIGIAIMTALHAIDFIRKDNNKTNQVNQPQTNNDKQVVIKDLIFKLQDGTVVKLNSVSPLEITVLDKGIILKKDGYYYYYEKGNVLYVFSESEYLKMKKENKITSNQNQKNEEKQK